MPRWLTDRLRLAARKALNRWVPKLVVFAYTSTQGEIDELVARTMERVFGRITAGQSAPQQDRKLH